MIISHRNKYIFIKNRKTAGTSTELILVQSCGPDDIITITPHGRSIGSSFNNNPKLPGPQNHRMPLYKYRMSDWTKLLTKGKVKRRFYNHAPADYIRAEINADIWKNYYKFCFERNPFDKAVSLYYWQKHGLKGEAPDDINEYILSVQPERLSNWHLYSIKGALAMDFVGNYNSLEADLETIRSYLNLPSLGSLPKTKAGLRDNNLHYKNLLSPEAKARIESICANEIKAFGFQW